MKLPLIQKPFRYRYFDAATMLVVVNAAIYFLSDFIWPSLNDSLALIPMEIKADGHWWTVVTYMFAHGSTMHLFSNMFGLIIFGRIMEKTIGSKEFLLFYFFSGIMCGLASYWYYCSNGEYWVALIGASGCIYSIMVLFALLYPGARVYVFGIVPMKAWLLVIVYFFIEYFSQSRADGIAHATHLFGLLFGLIYAVVRMGINPFAIFKKKPADGSAGK